MRRHASGYFELGAECYGQMLVSQLALRLHVTELANTKWPIRIRQPAARLFSPLCNSAAEGAMRNVDNSETSMA